MMQMCYNPSHQFEGEAMVIYIHGFGGSGEGVKARIVRDYFKEDRVLTPSLSYVPELAIQTLTELILLCKSQDEQVYLIGSSLGGYYALFLADRFDLSVVLINPSIHPYKTLALWTGQAKNFYDESSFLWDERHIAMLRQYEVSPLLRQEKVMLMVQKGDETLDYREAVAKLSDARTIIEEGGSHSFEGFASRLDEIRAFFMSHERIAKDK